MKCHYGHRSCVFVFPLPNYAEGPVMHPFQTRSWDQTFQGWVVNKGIKSFRFSGENAFFFFFLKKNIAGKFGLDHFPVYFGLSFLTSSSETLFFDAVVTCNDSIKRKTNQPIPQSGEVKSLLQHTSPGIFWNRLQYNKCACFIIDLSSGANKQGCDYSLYTYKVFLCFRVWEGWLHPLRNYPIQRQLYYSFIKNKNKNGERQHTLLPSYTAGVGGPLRWKTPAETTKEIWFQHLKWMSAECPAPHTLTFGLGCDVASYFKQESKGKALQQKESSAWVWRGQRGRNKAALWLGTESKESHWHWSK